MGNKLVGDPRTLLAGEHPSLDSLLIVLKNGLPDRVVPPGGRIWRGWRAPVMGSLEVVPVNRGTVEVSLTVRDVVTGDPEKYLVRAVPLEARVRLNPNDGYRYLSQYARRRGASFSEDLLVDLRNGLDALVRSVFARHRHDVLLGASLGHLLKPQPSPLAYADNLLLLETITVTSQVEWSQVFLDVKNARDQALVGLEQNRTDETVGIDRAKVDRAIEEARFLEFAPLARQLGLPVEAFVKPEALEASRAAAMQLLTTLLEPGNRAHLHRNPELLSRLVEQTGIGQLASGIDVAPPEPIAYEHPDSALRPDVTQPLLTARGDEPAELELTVDRRLSRILAASGTGLPRILGLGSATNGTRGTVVLVTDEACEVPASHVTQMAELLRVQHVELQSLVAVTYTELGAAWLHQNLQGSSRDVSLLARTRMDGSLEILEFILQGEPRECYAAIQRLNAPTLTARAALESILPFAALDIRMGQ